MRLPFKIFSSNLSEIKYYLPLIFYIFIFSGGFNDFFSFNFSSISYHVLSVYTLKYLSSSFLEEFVFRGFILGIFILNFSSTKHGILKSVVFSGLIFGLMHIINLWTFENQTINGVLNQVYATTCFGVMYGATYLKTRSILTLGILHFISNFFASITELNFIEVIDNSISIVDKSLTNTIISEVFRIIIFGIPLVIGLYLIYNSDKDDIKKLNSENYNLA
jgi:membrane protease YdiL (CAAX protease family)